MGEGLKQMLHVSSPRAEDDDEVGENSDSDSVPNDSSLHELSSLVSQLPVKKGLSKFYRGKSRSLSSFSEVRTVEDLAKKGAPIKTTVKPSRGYAGGLDGGGTHGSQDDVKASLATPRKGNARGSCARSIARTSGGGGGGGGGYFSKSKPPPVPTHNKNTM